MPGKIVIIGSVLVAATLSLGAIRWGESSEQGQLRCEQQREIERLQAALAVQEGENVEIRRQLNESLDMLEAQDTQERRHNCTPARNSLVYFQWCDKNGHEERATRSLASWIERHGRNDRQVLEQAWSLMTSRETMREFDRAALRLAEHAVQDDEEPSARACDVLAMAKFFDGQVEEAVSLQQRAIASEDRDDYRRRLRMYEAALAAKGTDSQLPAHGTLVTP
ncbi:MAG: hypothetical protein H6832_07420 [Planctomycetes bacterium]|nr:hypothetical protein [Planctomycetota bacterium]